MDVETFAWLLTGEGRSLVATATGLAAEGVDPLRAGDLLRRSSSAERAAAATGQVALRRAAVAKLGPEAGQMYFTPEGLQQSTRREVSQHRAERLRRSLGDSGDVLDLGCGIGGDLVAFARAGLHPHGVDLDPLRVAVARANLSALGLVGDVTRGDATETDLAGWDALFVDPARRTARGRTFDVDAYTPPWDFVESVLSRHACAKVAPGVPHDRVPAGVEAEWVSVDGEVKEAALWSPHLATAGRRATVIRGGSTTTVTEAEDPGAAETRPVGAFLVEPDGAVIRAGLVTAVAAEVGGWLPDEHIAYVSTDHEPRTKLGRGFAVVERLPYQEKQLKAALRERRIGSLTIKKRGVDVVPDLLRKRLALRGDRAATLVLTREAGKGVALLVDPLPH